MRNILNSFRLLILAAVVVSVTLVLASSPAQAQPGLTNQGREFWLGFMPNTELTASRINIKVATEVANKIKVETYGENGAIVRSQSLTLGAHEAGTFEMSVPLSETRAQEKVAYHAIRVTSTSPCSVYGYSECALSTGAYLGLPLQTYGTEYYCVSYFDDTYYFLEIAILVVNS